MPPLRTGVQELCAPCKKRNEIPYGNFDRLSSSVLPSMGLGSGKVPIDIGSLSELASRQHECSFCRLVLHAVSSSWGLSTAELVAAHGSVEFTLCNRLVGFITEPNATEIHAEDFFRNKFDYAHGRLEIECDTAPAGCASQFDIQAIDDGPTVRGLFDDAPMFTRRPEERMRQIQFGLLRNWVSHCRDTHGDSCRPDDTGSSSTDVYLKYLRFIDVIDQRLVNALPDHEYVALSYVWGRDPFLRLLASTEKRLFQAGSIGPDSHDVPKTIRHAIQVVKQLGLRYIWVDALCIMQDDFDEKPHVIGAMDLIYSRAQLTIVAASGTHADAGIPGVEPGTRDVRPFELTAAFPESSHQFVVARERPSATIQKSRWNSRGWTYQERLCSHRLLLFTEQQAVYLCGRAAWCEDTVLESDDPRVRYEEQPLTSLNLPNDKTNSFMRAASKDNIRSPLREYTKIVETYTSRDLTFPGDILDAFTGALKRFETSWRGEGVEVAFLFGLPTTWFELGLLWNPEGGSTGWTRRRDRWRHPSGIEIDFPSWSWMGWTGRMTSGLGYVRTFLTLPEIEWFYIEPGSNAVRRITSQIYDRKEQYAQPKMPTAQSMLRDKWKPQDAPFAVTEGDLTGFSHVNIAGKLVFYTSSCYLSFVGRHHAFTTTLHEYGIVGHHGTIQLDPDWASKHVGQKFEFIVIGRLSRSQESDQDNLHVMLVERENDIAYRVGVGWITESDWITESLAWKMVVLG